MKSIQKNLAALAIAAFGIGFAPSAGARSVSGWSGEPQNLENGGCFSESYATVSQSGCSGTQTWEVPLVVDAGGTWNVTVNVTAASSTASISCLAFAITQDGSTHTQSTQYYPSSTGVAQNLPTMSVSVPSAGAMYLACFMNQGTKINTVNWNQ
jgi:hypothetical protein